ncbi:hypothetical protein EV127DRAFT_432124 [Xylaria flabelliformis]|nr:hypothetical protein EV127DRAFT_432124 [Xylaria flabelliformis]
MDAYAAAMNQPQQQSQRPHQQSPRGVTLEDIPPNSHRRNNSHFDSHDDFYAFLDSNRGPSMASGAGPSGPSGPVASERSPPPAPMPPLQQQQQQQQQRNLPSQSRPPVTNIFPDRSRPPSYAGSRSEELLVDKSTGAKMARQNQRRGVPPTTTKQSPGPRQRTTSPTPPVSGGSSPTHPHSSRPVSGAGERDPATGPVPRLKSPSVLECVLQPLDQKVREYNQLMRREQEELNHLDEELRMLQARRAEAEGRFDEAKAKHDEYRRQYADVERAMSGELAMLPREPQHLLQQQQQQQQQQRPTTMQGAGPMGQQRPMSARRFGDDVDGEDFDDDEDFAVPPFGPGRRINSQQSFSRASQKTGGKERFRFSSLFGGGR